MVNKWLRHKDYSIKYKNFKMYFISECTLFRNRIKYIFLSGCSGGVVLGEKIKYIFKLLHFGNFINSGIKWVTRIPKAVIRKKG